VIAPKSRNPQDVQLESRAVASGVLPPAALFDEEAKARGGVLLLDLSGDKRAAVEWAACHFPDASIRPVNKADLKWSSKREAVKRLRLGSAHTFAIFASDLEAQSAARALLLFGMLVAPRAVFGDRRGRVITRSRPAFLFIDVPKLALDLILGYLVLVPAVWVGIELLSVGLALRQVARASRRKNEPTSRRGRRILVLRATLAAAAAGGMSSHLEGFVRGCGELGHTMRLVISGAPQGGEPGESLRACSGVNQVSFIRPSAALSPTKAVFELWNNLVFTARAWRMARLRTKEDGDIDFIYQRYSRFNWTGVLLSITEGLPLALEYNGSEAWVSQRWDPVGQLHLLRRLERLNQRAADVIFAVSKVESDNLIKAGVDAGKIVVNPNGVDAEQFRPVEGSKVRKALGIGDEVVVGFLGTFGPWHGAPSLASAALQVSQTAGCHFLFIGDGDERARTEAIVQSGGGRVRARFLGRVPHSRIPDYLGACDILASPHMPATDGSEFFGSPTKLFEYMAVGRAIVASRLGQIAEVIVDEQNGLLVPPGDSAALAQAIERLARDAPLRTRLGAAARRTVQDKYTWRHNAARVIAEMERGRYLADRN